MAAAATELFGKGIYTLPDASRLTRVSPSRIRYWLHGSPSERKRKERPRLWTGVLRPMDDKIALGFLDLHEVRFIDAFLKAGVTWKFLRAVHGAARARYGIEHPFCTRRFVTDGVDIFEETRVKGDLPMYEDLAREQLLFRDIVKPLLCELEFAATDELVRWWPLGTNRQVVLDPGRQFGQPIAAQSGVATEIIAAASKAGQSDQQIAEWYELEISAVRDSIEFELGLAA